MKTLVKVQDGTPRAERKLAQVVAKSLNQMGADEEPAFDGACTLGELRSHLIYCHKWLEKGEEAENPIPAFNREADIAYDLDDDEAKEST